MKRRTSLSFWPEFLHPVFRAIGCAMNGRQLHPDILTKLTPIEIPLSGIHNVQIRHVSGETAKPGVNRYEIRISGNAIDGAWFFRSGELQSLAREAVTTLNDR